MRLCSVLWAISALLVVSGTLDLNFFTQNRKYVPTSQINCYEYSKFNTDRLGRAFNDDWRPQKSTYRSVMPRSVSSAPIKQLNSNVVISRRFDDLLLKHDIFKEHAKLVQDINSLKQVVFVAPLPPVDDIKDYDESIFHEIIETFSTTTPRPHSKTTKPIKASSIPVILLGGASTRQIVRSQPLSFPKSTINLVGTTGSPLLKHPYPFVVQAPQKPLRVCMPTMALSTTTRRPTLWERLIKTLIPR